MPLANQRCVRPIAIFVAAICWLAAGTSLSAQVIHYWRFENSPGFLSDSVGGATLTNVSSSASQATLPGTGRGSEFTDVSSAMAAELDEGDRFTGTVTALTGSFSIEAFVHRDTNSGVYEDVIAAAGSTVADATTHGWNLLIRLDGLESSGVGELALFVSNGSSGTFMKSGRVITPGKDFYVAATFDFAGGQTTFYVQNLTDSGSLLTSTASHALSSVASYTTLHVGGATGHAVGDVHFDGLIDELRISSGVLAQGNLLITAIPEPGTWAAILGSLVLAAAAWRRRFQGAGVRR